MEHVIEADVSGIVRARRRRSRRHRRSRASRSLSSRRRRSAAAQRPSRPAVGSRPRSDPTSPRSLQRHAHDAATTVRPEAVARRRATGQRTARENVEDLCDPGSFVEYGALVIAAQRRRRTMEDLIAQTPADGLVAGIGRVNGDLFDDDASRCMVHVVRLHRPRRDAGSPEPSQEGPDVRARRADAAAGRGLHRRRWGRPGDTDGTGRRGPRLHGVQLASAASVRARAARRRSTPADASRATRRCSAAATW